MSRREKRKVSRELAALASLRDSDIDTSDIPEIRDWSQAVVGRFYSFEKTGAVHLADLTPDAQQFPAIAFAEMTPQQLIAQCSRGVAGAWTEFMSRFHRLIATVVIRATRQWGGTSPELIDDLMQEVYLKLTANGFEILQKFQFVHENAFLGFVKVVAANVAYDYFRTAYASKRGAAGSTSDELDPGLVVLHSSGAVEKVENAVLMEEIDRGLKAVASDKERAIFWLYYRDGLSAKTIASLPAIQLSVKGIESAIVRLTKALRHELAQALPAHQHQRGTIDLPLVDQRERRSPKKRKD